MFEQLVSGVRVLNADDLGIGVKAKAAVGHSSSAPDAPEVPADHPRIQEIVRLAERHRAVLLTGPPGTSKSHYAAEAADVLVNRVQKRRRYIQFHASYQYEDFMMGFSPTDSGFEVKRGPFLELADEANDDPEHMYVLVIDELSRADVGRVFGEALTYIERRKREQPFTIANGREVKIPMNLIIIATMNPFDRGVDEVDAAFERRFPKIAMDPDRDELDEILTENGMDETLKTRVLGWFSRINSHARKIPAAAVGHAYFIGESDESTLRDLWNYQLKYVVQRAFRREENTRMDLETAWDQIFFELPDVDDDITRGQAAP
ncbi:McrB family protein [Nocardia brasiliensis]|uniref:McrB family protein n=1 Tax=Nocardia brasiliensis TaxID=37326 RepID=UPI002456A4A9|nr:AAA family ATPase [Nocardia brasiliensis]